MQRVGTSAIALALAFAGIDAQLPAQESRVYQTTALESVFPTANDDTQLVSHSECAPDACDSGLGCDGVGAACNSCGAGGGCWASLCGDTPLLGCLKNRESCWCDDIKYSLGGEIRYRYMDERNRLRPMGQLRRDTYDLWRITPYAQLSYRDWVTGYVQAIDASIFGNDISILPIDKNRGDLLQYYVDFNVAETSYGDLHYRYGRQFLKYGSEHLVSPLGWSNTFRNFEGHRAYLAGDAWTVDVFAVQPVNGAAVATQFRPIRHDVADQSFWFSGVYATYLNAPYGVLDLYWLWMDESQPLPVLQDGRRHTIGARYEGSRPVAGGSAALLWDLEGAYQFGEDNFGIQGTSLDVSAGFVSLIGGLTAKDVPWTPTLKGLFWWGSGDSDPTDGHINTVTTLFPLGHAYWGLIDNFNGANLLDYSLQLSVKPTQKLTLASHWHWFDKAQARDHIYNIGGVALGNTTTPGRHLGNELDLIATYAFNPNLSVQLGYFWFWYGDAVDNNAGILARNDAQQFYFMGTWAF